MRPLSAHQILQIWEVGQGQSTPDRALALLSVACPEQTVESLAGLTVGQRDASLLCLRELTLGSQLNGFTTCPQCQERLEFQLNAGDFHLTDPTTPPPDTLVLQMDGLEVQFRLPNSWDLAAIAPCKDVETADAVLLQRCILQASREGTTVNANDLPAECILQLTEQMVEADPQAEILLTLHCAACQHEWRALFDILSFFWAELGTQAKRLLQEVHTLARFYGWREADILGMSAKRRQLYLEMVTGE